MEIYLVGGAVRDSLLNYPVVERDWVVVGATPQQMKNQGYKAVGADFPVFLHPQTGEEYALARTERKTAPGYKGFQFHAAEDVTLEQDLLRRDLTINAIAQDEQGNLFDPYNGRADLDARILRHVSPAFAEDPLRVLRVARFAARYHHLGFTIAPETLALMSQLAASGELDALTPERVWKETERALGERSPQLFIDVLRQCGALKILFPEVDALFGVPQRADYHPEVDSGIHTIMSLQQSALLSDDTAVRFAVLVHDLGKAITPSDILPRHIGHEERGVPLVKALSERLKVPNRFRVLAEKVTRYHLLCHKAQTLRPATVLKVLKGLDVFRQPDQLEPFLLACTADARGRTGFENCEYPSANWLRSIYQELKTVSAKEFVEQGKKGAEIAEAMDKKRLEIISEFKKTFCSN
ncbi:multifunctional CCA addition/repair protein [Porticoccus sp. W117]|uniref:multifunctional CCA addition/repair protein n=1 Tax=Porticoccus sp. W117 TaxID=3054777 RepID=UPI002594EDF5|nr:multifunctional CCA addition/repair protein [Porticoccus sp. W117]MDM3870233.1 multifunctional CCA addition/repair protein [Porticoccus sp. W117]